MALRVKSEIHGDQIELYIRVMDGHVAEVRYLTFGCVTAIASVTSELATGLSGRGGSHHA